MLLLGVGLLPTGHLREIGQSHTERFLEVGIGEILEESSLVAARGIGSTGLQSFERKLGKRGFEET